MTEKFVATNYTNEHECFLANVKHKGQAGFQDARIQGDRETTQPVGALIKIFVKVIS